MATRARHRARGRMPLGHLGHALAVACAHHARQADGRAAGRPLGHLGHGQMRDPNDPMTMAPAFCTRRTGSGLLGHLGHWVIKFKLAPVNLVVNPM